MNKKIVVGVAGVCVVAAAAGAFMSGRKAVETTGEIRPVVEVSAPEIADIAVETSLIGTVEPEMTATVWPKISGEIIDIQFSAGDEVTEGQVLCIIDSDALDTLKINMDAAKISMDDAQRALERTQALVGTGAVSDQSLEQAQSAATGARLQYEAAKKNYDLQVEYSTITAPISGTVELRGINLHDTVSPADQICVISSKEQNTVKFGVTEKVMKNLSIGDKLTLERDGSIYEGTITEIGSMVNSATGLYQVWAAVDQGEALTTGSRVKLEVTMEKAEDTMSVPIKAVYYDDGNPYVYCYENGIAVTVPVETGLYDEERMEIKSGLQMDDQVITTWSNEMFDGAKVRLSEQTEKEDDGTGVTVEQVQEG